MDKNLDASGRASKKQQELYDFVADFIGENGYGPSYREIMNALGYKSVSTVAVHVDGLIKKGYLKKLEGGARSLAIADKAEDTEKEAEHILWLRAKVDVHIKQTGDRATAAELANQQILQDALIILGINGEGNDE